MVSSASLFFTDSFDSPGCAVAEEHKGEQSPKGSDGLKYSATARRKGPPSPKNALGVVSRSCDMSDNAFAADSARLHCGDPRR